MEPPDLSRPSTRLTAIGEISMTAATAASAARDLVIFLADISLLLGPPTQPPRLRPHLPATYTSTDPPPLYNSTVFKALRFFAVHGGANPLCEPYSIIFLVQTLCSTLLKAATCRPVTRKKY